VNSRRIQEEEIQEAEWWIIVKLTIDYFESQIKPYSVIVKWILVARNNVVT
jgi:hypothetical protein